MHEKWVLATLVGLFLPTSMLDIAMSSAMFKDDRKTFQNGHLTMQPG